MYGMGTPGARNIAVHHDAEAEDVTRPPRVLPPASVESRIAWGSWRFWIPAAPMS